MIVAGYSDLPDTSAPMTTTLQIQPREGESISVIRNGTIPVTSGQLIIGVMASDFVRGKTATLRFSLFNPGAAEVEIITAGAGGGPSPEVRFKLMTLDGEILATVPFQASIGQYIVNLPNNTAVLRLPAGAQVVCDPISAPLSANAPRRIIASVEIDKVYYHSDGSDRVEMDGVHSGQEFAVIDTSYAAQVTSVTPAESNGSQPVTISGNAWFRYNHQPAPNVPLLVKISNNGFERSLDALSDTDGTFTVTFTPLANEAGGIYNVWAVHPDLSDRMAQSTFVIERVLASPSQFGIRVPHYYVQNVPLTLTPGPGTVATNVHVEFRAQDQPGGALPAGVSVGLGNPIPVLGSSRSATINLTFSGTPSAPRTGDLVLFVTSDDAGTNGWQKIPVNFEFSEAFPSLRWTPNFVDTGVSPSNSVSETVTLENVGLVAAMNLTFSLVSQDGSATPKWASLTVLTNAPQLAVGDHLDIGLAFSPPVGTLEGDYMFTLRIRAENCPNVDLGVHVAVVNSGIGDAQFKIVDLFTSTNFVDGVKGALVRLQNDQITSIQTNITTDEHGECIFSGLPAGLYKYQVTADKHNSSNGRLWVRAGSTVSQQVALDYSLVSVTWEVVPITIEDRYEIVLNAVFETDVPAPVVTLSPAAINLPQMFAGDVYFGEFSLENHGLIRADNLAFNMPATDDRFTYEVLAGIPDHLDARQKVRIPYRVTCKVDMPGPNQRPTTSVPVAPPSPTMSLRKLAATSDGCFTYQGPVYGSYTWVCINGLPYKSGFNGLIGYSYVKSCNGGGGASGGGPVFGGGGSSGGGGGATYSKPSPPPRAPECFPPKGCPPPPAPPGNCKNVVVCKDPCPDSKESVGSWVSLVNREYQDEVKDLGFKVPGSELRVMRQFYHNAWHWRDLMQTLVFDSSAQGISSIHYGLTTYLPLDANHTVFQFRDARIIRLSDGWRWQNLDGAWEIYDTNGRLLRSGNRNITVATYIYDETGQLLSVNDQNNRVAFRCEYMNGVLSAVSDLAGRRVVYTWSNGRLIKVKDALNQDTTYDYDGNGHMTRKTDVSGKVAIITYDGGGYVESVLDEQGNGKYFIYSYDANARQYYAQVRTTGGLIKEKRFDTDGFLVSSAENGISRRQILRDGRTTRTTGASGAITLSEYDEYGNLIRETRPDGGVVTWEYDPGLNQPVRKVDQRGSVTLMSYDNNGNLTNRIEAAGTVIARTNSWVYDTNGFMVCKIDGRRNKMDYIYDTMGNLLREYDPENPTHQTFYAYDAYGNCIAITNASGYVTLYGYDLANRLVAETNASGYVSLWTYKGNNLVETETGRDGANRGRIVRYHYDLAGRRTQTSRLDAQGQENVWETVAYDSDGHVVAVANALGQITRYSYNLLGQNIAIQRPFSATETSDTQYDYDDAGRMVQQTDPLGVKKKHEYDNLDRECKVTEALGTSLQRCLEYGYDSSGNLISITWSDLTNSLTTTYGYDLLSHRTQIRGAREYPKDFEYDANNNLTAEVNGRAYRTQNAYDQYNRRTNTIEGIGNTEVGECTWSCVYDMLGNLIRSSDGDGNHRHYHYDALGRKTQESVAFGPTDAPPANNWWEAPASVLERDSFNQWGQLVASSNIVGGGDHNCL